MLLQRRHISTTASSLPSLNLHHPPLSFQTIMSRQHDPPPSFSVNPQTPTRELRHQSSLEHVFNFTLCSPPPTSQQADEAHFLFNTILNDCEELGLFLEIGDGDGNSDGDDDDGDGDDNDDDNDDHDGDKVYLHNLFRALIEFCPTDSAGLNIVRMILHGLFCSGRVSRTERSLSAVLPLARTWLTATDDQRQPIYRILETVATDFLIGFFVPLTAQASITPNVSGLITPPAAAAHVALPQGTPHRLRGLRQTCLVRDGYRCVVSGHLDLEVHNRRARRQSRRRVQQHGGFGVQTQAAHIIPHSLNSIRSIGDALSPAKNFVWQILNMFDTGISAELEGARIDRPSNAMILATELHHEFGKLRCYLDEVAPNVYSFRRTRFASALSPAANPKAEFITFQNHEPNGTNWADLPSARLLKLHAACCKMMEMAGAAGYVDAVIRNLDRMEEEGTLAADGTSDLGMLLFSKGLWGWERGQEADKRCEHDVSVVI